MAAYYNENDLFAAGWLQQLIDAKLIASGEVDKRSIEDVAPDDVGGFTQCHFFAGIGGWSQALRLAGWPDDQPVWTGSCPCQPFSAAGKGTGTTDQRHLWPAWFHLIEQCRPTVIFGEQVTTAIKHNWLDAVQDDMEGIGYAFWSHGLAASNIGAPHQRKRLYFLGDTYDEGPQRRLLGSNSPNQRVIGPPGLVNGFWQGADWLWCSDGKYRPVESGTFPLAYGLPARVGRLRGYGNAIVPQCAQAFIETYLEVTKE